MERNVLISKLLSTIFSGKKIAYSRYSQNCDNCLGPGFLKDFQSTIPFVRFTSMPTIVWRCFSIFSLWVCRRGNRELSLKERMGWERHKRTFPVFNRREGFFSILARRQLTQVHRGRGGGNLACNALRQTQIYRSRVQHTRHAYVCARTVGPFLELSRRRFCSRCNCRHDSAVVSGELSDACGIARDLIASARFVP